MSPPKIIRRLTKLFLLSVAGWTAVAFVISANFLINQGGDWRGVAQGSLRDWLPWAILTPFIFLLVDRWPVDRQRWKISLPLHLVFGAVCVVLIHAWKESRRNESGGPSFGEGRPPSGGGLRQGMGEPRGQRRLPAPRRQQQDQAGFPDNRPPFPDDAGGSERGPPGDRDFDGPPPEPGEGRPDNSGRPPPRGDDSRGSSGPGGSGGRGPGGPGGGGGRGGPGQGRFFDALHFVSFELPIYLMLVFAAHTAVFFRRSQERAVSLARARLDVLRAQLQPHFLFNTLNTIAGLVHGEPDKADAMLTALSDLLRDTLQTSSDTEVPLSRELEMTSRYVAIMQVRFEERLRVEWDVADDTRAALVPPLLLQPLVENAVEHGIAPLTRGGTVRISARREGGILHLSVRDNGQGLHEDGEHRHGIGLNSTRERLHQLHGEAARLTLTNGDGVTVVITLPFRTAS